MKKEYFFIFLCLILSLFFEGCNFGGAVFPGDEFLAWDFEGVVSSLNTPEKLVDYMTEHFVAYSETPDDYEPFLPEDFFYIAIGNHEDFAAFNFYVLDQHGYDVFSMYYLAFSDQSKEINRHTVSVFKTEGGETELHY